MPNTLKLKFTGLCGLVPKKPIDEANNQLRVFLVDVRNPSGHDGHQHEQHAPVLTCEFARVVTGSGLREPDRIYMDPKHFVLMALFDLSDQDLRIDGATGNSLTFAGPSSIGTCPTINNIDSFSWTAPLASISTGSATLRASCFSPTNVDTSVVARVSITQGVVSTSKMARDTSNKILKWEFKVSPTGSPVALKRAIGEEVELRYTFNSSDIDFKTRNFRSSTSPTETIRLKPPANNIVTAAVQNVPWKELLSVVHNPKPDHRDPDHHFVHFYDWSQTPGVKNIPHPLLTVSRCSEVPPPAPGLNNTQCPPVLLGSNNGA